MNEDSKQNVSKKKQKAQKEEKFDLSRTSRQPQKISQRNCSKRLNMKNYKILIFGTYK